MSKSQGNVIAPQDIIKHFGADILRLWVMSSDYNEDVRISPEILSVVTDAYRKIRNTARFILSNLSDFDPDKDALGPDRLLEIDQWALFKLDRLVADVTKGFDEFRFYHVFQKVYGFCNEDMSSLYLDILKDRLYTAGKDSEERRSAQTVIYEILDRLTRMLSPVLPFTAEEIYRSMRHRRKDSCASIHLCSWPASNKESDAPAQEVREMGEILNLRPQVLKALEAKRSAGAIGSSLEAKVVLTFKERRVFENFSRHAKHLPFVFIVSQVEVKGDQHMSEPFDIMVSRSDGKKCVRCWNYSLDVDTHEGFPGICSRCVRALVK